MTTNAPIREPQAPDPRGLAGAGPSRAAIPDSRPRPSGWSWVLWLLVAVAVALIHGNPWIRREECRSQMR
jgi:hypothetical protein